MINYSVILECEEKGYNFIYNRSVSRYLTEKELIEFISIIIINGKPQYQVIRELKMTVETVFEKLDIKSKRDLNNILVASYDTEKKDFLVHRK